MELRYHSGQTNISTVRKQWFEMILEVICAKICSVVLPEMGRRLRWSVMFLGTCSGDYHRVRRCHCITPLPVIHPACLFAVRQPLSSAPTLAFEGAAVHHLAREKLANEGIEYLCG